MLGLQSQNKGITLALQKIPSFWIAFVWIRKIELYRLNNTVPIHIFTENTQIKQILTKYEA